jgi:hypothetical protein
MRFYIVGKKDAANAKVVASVGYGNDVAFHAVADDYAALMQQVTRTAAMHFPGLLETKRVAIGISKAYLHETGVPDNMFNRALKRLPGRTIADKELPPEIAVPLELELAPIVGFGAEGYAVDNLDILKRRNLLSKREVFALEHARTARAVLTEIDGRPLWKLLSSDDNTEAKYVDAHITRRLTVEIPLTTTE